MAEIKPYKSQLELELEPPLFYCLYNNLSDFPSQLVLDTLEQTASTYSGWECFFQNFKFL